jgi:hypothetical protein
VQYASYFKYGRFVEKNVKVYVEWLEKAANQNNPYAMDRLGEWFQGKGGDEKKAVSYFRAAAELGWKDSMRYLAIMLRDGEGCVKDFRQAVIWSAKGAPYSFHNMLADAKRALESRTAEDLGCDFNQICYLLGWGLYWYRYGSEDWNLHSEKVKAFGNRCLDYYCSCVELQQESIITFLLCWNWMTGVK